MPTIRITAKRQATFPRRVCEQMRLKPGDSLVVDARVVDGERVWVLLPAQAPKPPWFGSLRRYAQGKSHGMRAIRRSIAKARKDGRL